MFYKDLQNTIRKHNAAYLKHQTLYVKHQTPEHDRTRRDHENEYANQISDMILHNIPKLTPETCALLDLIPYKVWAKMTAKSRIIAQTVINRL